MEELDIMNIIECEEILEVIQDKKRLVDFFMFIVDIVNNRVNGRDLDTPIKILPLEENIEPILSSDSEDDIIEDYPLL
tara:strand:- start:230 stop:463 length:234 start_codon:yes stop_codon:yes gene_type:complete